MEMLNEIICAQAAFLTASLPEMPPIVPVIALIILLVAAIILVRSLMNSGKSQSKKPKKAKKTDNKPKKSKQSGKQVKNKESSENHKTDLISNDYEGTILLDQNAGDQHGSSTVVNTTIPSMTIIDVANPNQRCTVCMNHIYRLGRDEELCDIVFPADPYISREQCEIYCQNGTVFIRNLSRKNITRINNREERNPVPLNNGTEILIGNTALRVEIHLGN